MTRTFIKRFPKHIDIARVNEETGAVELLFQDPELGFVISDFTTTISEMGHKTARDLFKRFKENGKQEVDTQTQKQSEINGLLNLAKYRKEHSRHFSDIPERLTAYGFTLEDAEKMVLEAVL